METRATALGVVRWCFGGLFLDKDGILNLQCMKKGPSRRRVKQNESVKEREDGPCDKERTGRA